MVETQELKKQKNDSDFWEQIEFEQQKIKNRKIGSKNPDASDLAKLYEQYFIQVPVTGTIVNVKYEGVLSNQHCFSSPGFKDYVRVENRQAENKYLKNTNVGDQIDVQIVNINEDQYMIQGSICSIYETAAHLSLKSLNGDTVIMATVKSMNPAGYDIEILHEGITLPGFMPNTLAGINKLHDPEAIVGQTFEVMIESFSKEEGTYIVSRRKYLKTLIADSIESLEFGEVYTGHVTGTTQFGVFVEFNDCLTGMIHKANISPDWQDKLAQIRPGTLIDFYVKEIIKDKIILTQILRETLWDTIKNGQVIDGRVKDIKQFGVLVYLDDETMGLIHTSELEKIRRKFVANQEIKVKVLAVDRQNRKIFLTA
jgi:small subunit ribosomal protein S1